MKLMFEFGQTKKFEFVKSAVPLVVVMVYSVKSSWAEEYTFTLKLFEVDELPQPKAFIKMVAVPT